MAHFPTSVADERDPAAATRTMAYVANADSREIHVLALNEPNGRAHTVQQVSVSGRVMPLAISPDRRHLFAALASEPFAVSSFAIHPKTGQLTSLTTVPLAANMAYLSTDRTGRYLLGASYDDHCFSVNAINSAGEVQPEPLVVVPTGEHAHCVLPDVSNRFLLVTNLGDDAIGVYRFDETTGRIEPNQPPSAKTPPRAGPRHLVFHPNGRFVFGSNELDASLSTYRFDAAGALTLLHSVSVLPAGFQGKPWAADLHLTPDGRFLYASERTSSTLAAFRVQADGGQLTRIGTYPTETQPRDFAIDPAGRYLLAVGERSNALSTYAIDDRTGALRHLSHLAVGQHPNWVEVIALPK